MFCWKHNMLFYSHQRIDYMYSVRGHMGGPLHTFTIKIVPEHFLVVLIQNTGNHTVL